MKLKIIGTASLLVTIFVADYFKVQDSCGFYCSRSLDSVLQWLFIDISIFFIFLLITSISKKIFSYWWPFAIVFGPVVLLLSVFVSAGYLHNPNGTWQDMLDVPVLILLNGIFIVGSLIQIIRGYFQK
jgi:hypothetical protein